ncbi:hypothetical protein ACFW96_02570 [Streptomyces gardneri]|uniref:hypothetical protein n=1 Tax=Streptomyces gardneri TaxID=66892 RepID=UPI0036CAC529
MPTLSSIPVLTGNDRTNLTAVPEGLLLRGRHRNITIPAEAVARVRAEGTSVAVELRARIGATPTVYRIEGVDGARAVAFAEGVNSLIEPEEQEEQEEEVDGISLVVSDTRKTRWTLGADRRLKWFVLAILAVTVALAVFGGLTQGAVYPVITVFFAPIIGACFAGSMQELTQSLHARRLRRIGVKEFARPANLPGSYVYQDSTRLNHALIRLNAGPYVELVYDPADPADWVTVRPGFMERLSRAAGVFTFLCGIGGLALLQLLLSDL